jgi:Tol biopolymer transport system component
MSCNVFSVATGSDHLSLSHSGKVGRRRHGYQQRGELVHYDSSSKQFAPFLGGIDAYAVAFSRDGKRVAYVDTPSQTLWMSRADGSEKVQLTSAPDRADLPRWSPDGSQIVYMSHHLGQPWKIFLVPSQGGTPEELLPEDRVETDPTWSADGSRIAYASGLPIPGQKSDIRILDLKTRQVSSIPGSNDMFSPRWSPDGRYLVGLNLESISKKLFLYDFQAGKWSEWIDDPGGIGYPAWSSDSRYLEYWSANNLKRIRLGNSRPENMFGLQTLNIYINPGLGPWNDNAADGSRMFLRDVSTQDIYALDLDLP